MEEKLHQLSLSNKKNEETPKIGKVAAAIDTFQKTAAAENSQRKIGPCVPPKPPKANVDAPQVPQSRLVAKAREPLYSRPLQGVVIDSINESETCGMLQRKQPIYATKSDKSLINSKSTLDNPAVLEQQLEALAYHKQQMEKRGLLTQQQSLQQSSKLQDTAEHQLPKHLGNSIPKLSSMSLMSSEQQSNVSYANMVKNDKDLHSNIYKNNEQQAQNDQSLSNKGNIYSNVLFSRRSGNDFMAPTHQSNIIGHLTVTTNEEDEDDLPPPPSPVSSSYSELRRATNVHVFEKPTKVFQGPAIVGNPNATVSGIVQSIDDGKNGYLEKNSCRNDYTIYSPMLQSVQSQNSSDYYGYGGISQSSSTYDSIYEPINPRPPSGMSLRSANYGTYASYTNSGQHVPCGMNLSTMSNSGFNTPVTYSSGGTPQLNNAHKEEEVEALTDYLVQSMDPNNEIDNFGICFKCKERVLGENTGCTAMDQVYHIACFTCCQCQINLQGKPFYALEGKPYCEFDYLQTLEKCSVCMKPILERILRATGKPYHPQCFTCVVCGLSLDGIPFTVDATNQNYCITDFHKKFAPRCCVCKEPIMPECGQEETVRVVALDRSFHLECYKCEDCGLLLSSEAEGRGCYPLDDHVLCKSCNAKRVQLLTKRMTTEL